MALPWHDWHEENIAWRTVLFPLWGAALVYGAAAQVHRGLYEREICDRRRLSCKVLSVGNITLGGSAKTPTAAFVASRLAGRGHKVVLASRGYGRRGGEAVNVVSDGRTLHSKPRQRGDEPLVLASHAFGVPVLVGPDRGVVGLRAIASYGAQVLVLDDGFQHHRLSRDLEILTFDGQFGIGNGHVFPRGPLREPKQNISHAQIIGVIDGPLAPRDEATIGKLAPNAYRFEATRIAWALRSLRGDTEVRPGILRGMRVGMLAALARPAGMRRSLEALGADVVAERTFRDHHRYRPRDLRGLKDQARVWVTSEKDAVKITPSWLRGLDLRVLESRLVVSDEDALLDQIECQLDLHGAR